MAVSDCSKLSKIGQDPMQNAEKVFRHNLQPRIVTGSPSSPSGTPNEYVQLSAVVKSLI